MSFFWFLIVGALAGWLAGKFTKGEGFGLPLNLVIGIAGGLIGGWLFGLMGIKTGGLIGGIVTSFVGAILLLYIVGKAKN